jgi:hypothetical protein
VADNLYKTLLSVVLRQNQNLTTSPTNAFNLNNPAVQNYLTAKLKGILPNASGAITENELMTAWLLANSGGGSGGTVTSVDISSNGTALTISGNPITTAGTIALDFNGANTDYVDGTGAVQAFPTITSGTVTTVSVVTNDGVSGTVANATTTPAITLDLGTITPDAISILGTSGNGYLKLRSQSSTVPTPTTGLTVWADNLNRFGWINPSAYAVSLDDTGLTASRNYTLPNASGTLALTSQLTSGTVTSVAALTLGTTGTDLSSTVANSTTTPVITLNVPTASATNRGVLTSTQYSNIASKSFGIVIDGGGNPLTTGIVGDVVIPFNCTITSWTIIADQTGSIVIDVWKDTYANYPPTVADTIAGSEKPTLSSASKNQDLALTTWTTAVTAGDIIRFNIDSASTVTRVTLSIQATL